MTVMDWLRFGLAMHQAVAPGKSAARVPNLQGQSLAVTGNYCLIGQNPQGADRPSCDSTAVLLRGALATFEPTYVRSHG
jgi:hypothetical protein